MRVIRPSSMVAARRRRPLLLALAMLGIGLLAGLVAMLAAGSVTGAGALGASSAVALGIGTAWLLRALDPRRGRPATERLVELLTPVFDDSYTLLVAPRLPVRDAARLDGLLIGPPGVRVVTVRDWDGRYRVRGRTWEFDARGHRGWIPCRTNPSHDAVALAEGVARWAGEAGLGEPPIRPAVAFPGARARIVLEEPAEEIVTTDNAPWWANSIGHVRRLDPDAAAQLVSVVLDASEVVRAPSAPSVAGGPS